MTLDEISKDLRECESHLANAVIERIDANRELQDARLDPYTEESELRMAKLRAFHAKCELQDAIEEYRFALRDYERAARRAAADKKGGAK